MSVWLEFWPENERLARVSARGCASRSSFGLVISVERRTPLPEVPDEVKPAPAVVEEEEEVEEYGDA